MELFADITPAAAPANLSLAFPESLTAKHRPHRIADFALMPDTRKLLSSIVKCPMPKAWLFEGAPGVGKTSAALAIAEEIGAELHHIPSQECNLENIERVRRTCQYVPRLGCRVHLVLIDEADQMTAAAQVSLLSKLDETNYPPNTIFIFTCNGTDRLEPRFLSRLRRVWFSTKGLSTAAIAHLEMVWRAEMGDAPAPNLARIVKESNNNIREALMTLETEMILAA